ncbi:glycosyltransferase [bacterium]|nr:glycosyltransferase [bacterium]
MYKIPLVSILICTYNAEKTIKNTLDSCLNQTYSSFEILIHDDQSKDKTLEVIESLGDQRIKVLES